MPISSGSLLELRLTSITFAAVDINVYSFERPDGGELPPFEAGAHVDLQVEDGLVRQYSLCSDPAERHRYSVAVLRQPGGRGGSQAWFERARCGQVYRVGVPRNLFPLMEEARSHRLLAGGIGITPMVAMVQALERRGARYTLHYCARSKERMAFGDTLATMVRSGELALHLDEGPGANPLDLASLLARQNEGEHVYCCGPQGFIDAAGRAAAHWNPGFFHVERFAPAPPASQVPGEGFHVVLARSGTKVFVAQDVSIAAALQAQGVDVPTSCEQGVCGMCQLTYLDGEPEHHDMVLLDEERKRYLLSCCARSRSPELLLDL
jgi:vanillate O-demethylase ferredoxin subunit